MDGARHQRLSDFIEDRVGDSLRGVVWYDAADWEAVYVRPDLATRELYDRLDEICDRARSTRSLFREADYPPLGETTATTDVHENGVVLHFPEGPESGTLVSLDRAVARDLSEFLLECTEVLQGDAAAEPPESSAE
jgi:hypothetical protein